MIPTHIFRCPIYVTNSLVRCRKIRRKFDTSIPTQIRQYRWPTLFVGYYLLTFEGIFTSHPMVKDVSIRFFLSVFLYYNQVPIVMPSPVDYCGNRENKKRALDCHQRSSEYINSWQPGKDQGFDPPLLLIIFLAIFAFGGLVWYSCRFPGGFFIFMKHHQWTAKRPWRPWW